MATNFITAVILTSTDPDRLADFYRETLDVPLEVEDHGGPKHYGCEMGELHFAIHPVRGDEAPGAGAVSFGLQIFDLAAFLKKLSAKGVEPLFPPTERGLALMSAVKDPDGNTIFLTQLTNEWLSWIDERRKAPQFDIVQQWKTR